MKRELKIVVKEIEGRCPAFKEGDEFLVKDGFLLSTTIPLCLHALASIMPYYVALSRGIDPEELNIGKGNRAYVQCLDACKYTGGGTVIFEIHIKRSTEDKEG